MGTAAVKSKGAQKFRKDCFVTMYPYWQECDANTEALQWHQPTLATAE